MPARGSTDRGNPESCASAARLPDTQAPPSAQAIYTWKRRFGELQPADIKRLRQLEAEHAKLKKIVAERDLEIDTMNEINRRKW